MTNNKSPLLSSRKVKVAISAVTAVILSVAAGYGFKLDETLVQTIIAAVVAVAYALITGIAKEDAAAKSAPPAQVTTVKEFESLPHKDVTTTTQTATPQVPQVAPSIPEGT